MLDWTLRRLGVGSSAKLAEVGEWLMVDTMEQLIAKIEAAAADDRAAEQACRTPAG